jgi:hypothetical protein
MSTTFPATPEEYEEYAATLQSRPLAKSKGPALGSLVKVGLLVLLIEEIDESSEAFTGSDADGQDYWFPLDNIDAMIP